MLTVPTYLDKSAVNGIGVFAAEFVPAHTIIWVLDPEFDLVVPLDQLGRFAPLVQETLRHYGFLDSATNNVILCNDNARFTNHSADPNTQAVGLMQTTVLKSIQAGEEITEDYFYFDGWAAEKLC
jgi:hypothetical protein